MNKRIVRCFWLVSAVVCIPFGRAEAAEKNSALASDESGKVKVAYGNWKLENQRWCSPGSGSLLFESVQGDAYSLKLKVKRIRAVEKDQHFGFKLQGENGALLQIFFRGDRGIRYRTEKEQEKAIGFRSQDFPLPGAASPWVDFEIIALPGSVEVKVDGWSFGKIPNPHNTRQAVFYTHGIYCEVREVQIVLPLRKKRTDTVPRKNLVSNSGFEQVTLDRLPDFWGCWHWGLQEPYWITHFSEWQKNYGVDTENPYEGKYSMRIHNPFHEKNNRSLSLRSNTLNAIRGKKYMLSAYMRSRPGGMKVSFHGKVFSLSEKWTRYSAEFIKSGNSYYEDTIQIYPLSKGTFWTDAVQLEEGTSVSEYAGYEKTQDTPFRFIPERNAHVVLDGKLDEAVWRDLPRLSFTDLYGKNAGLHTEAKVWHNEKGLYIGVECDGDAGTPCKATEADSETLMRDPSVEVFLSADTARENYIHLAVNKDNLRYDAAWKFFRDIRWNGKWLSAAYRDPLKNSWSVEFFIPFEILDINTQKDKIWRLNIGRNIDGGKSAAVWAPTFGSFHRYAAFGKIFLAPSFWKRYALSIENVRIERQDEKLARLLFSVQSLMPDTGGLRSEIVVNGNLYTGRSDPESGGLHHFCIPDIVCGDLNDTTAAIRLYSEKDLILRKEKTVEVIVPPILNARLQFDRVAGKELLLRLETEIPEPSGFSVEIAFNHLKINRSLSKEIEDIPLPLGDIKNGEHAVEVQLKNPEGRIILKRSLSFRKIVSEKNLVQVDFFSHMLRRNGRLFFPIGLYWEGEVPAEIMKTIADSGFNTICSDVTDLKSFGKVLDAAREHHIMVLPVMDRLSDADRDRMVKKYKGHPSILAWYAFDEVFARDEGRKNYSRICETMKRLQNLDDSKPVYLNENRYGLETLDLGKHSFPGPIVSIDFYVMPPKNDFWRYEFLGKDMRRRDLGKGRPRWLFLMGSGYAFWAGREWTPKEHNYCAYTSVIEGASGIFYFASHPKSAASLNAMKQIVRELNALTPALASSKNAPSVAANSKNINFTLKIFEKGLYIIAVNRLNIPQTVSFRTDKSIAGSAEVLFESRSVPVKSNSFTDHFAGYERHVYKLEISD